MATPSPRDLRDLALDLAVEAGKLDALVESLVALGAVEGDRLRIDAAALRLQSFYTGIERCLLQISRVLNGSTPDGGDWHRRLLERMGHPSEERPPCSPLRPSLLCRSCCAFAILCAISMPTTCSPNLWSGCEPSPSLSGLMCGAS